jgi:GDP-L-fucose synthase
MCAAYNRQYGTNYISVMPTNLYGPGDNYDLENSHVLPALIRRMHEAKEYENEEVVVWGTGGPRREFMHSDDLADAVVFLMEHVEARDLGEFVNIGSGRDVTITEAARLVADVVGFKGRLLFDDSRPDGAPQKLLDVSRMSHLGWRAQISLRQGLVSVYDDFRRRYKGS